MDRYWTAVDALFALPALASKRRVRKLGPGATANNCLYALRIVSITPKHP